MRFPIKSLRRQQSWVTEILELMVRLKFGGPPVSRNGIYIHICVHIYIYILIYIYIYIFHDA